MAKRTIQKTSSRIAVSIALTLVFAAIYFYVTLPAINLHNPTFYGFMVMCLLLYIVISMILVGVDTGKATITLKDYATFAKANCKAAVIILLVLGTLFVAGQVISLPVFRANAYHNLLQVDTGDFATEVAEVSFNEIPMLDESSAQRLGNRKLGELADMVSQFVISSDYVQINYHGRPVRVACLEYGDFFKWFNNRGEGLPAYVLVDMATQEVEVIRMSSLDASGIRYSPSEYFSRDLDRALRFAYPTFMFSSPHLEIDEDGNPWWVCPRETRTIGLFGGVDIIGAVLMDATTGECTYYEIEDIPVWVDRVYTASLITQQYDFHGTYINGFFNSIIGQKEVTVTTDGFNYIAMSDDVYMYTGITSVSADESNIGFLLSNQRTKEATFYSAPGAIERSAQDSAQGVVQDLGYKATFPLLLNIAGEPTYFMSLKDSSDLVKMYAMVNVAQYQLVATGNTVAECEANYIARLSASGIDTSGSTAGAVIDEDQTAVTGAVAEIRTAVMDGNSYYFVRLADDTLFYKIMAKEAPGVVLLNVGDEVTIRTSSDGAVGLTMANASAIDLTANLAEADSTEPAPETPDEAETEEAPAE